MEEQIFEGAPIADNKEYKSTPEDFMKLLEGDNIPKGGPLEPGGTGPHTPQIPNDDNLAMKKNTGKIS